MHISTQVALASHETEFCSVAEAPVVMNEKLAKWLGGVIVVGLIMIGFALPFA